MTSLSRHKWFLVCGIVVLTGLAYGLDGYPLLNPDEGRNAEVAREMAESGDYVVPRLNTAPYLDKPILFFASAAVSIRLFGATEVAVRLPSLLFTIMTVSLLFWFALREFGFEGAVTAAVVTAASPLVLGLARTVIFDASLTFFVTLTILSFYRAFDAYRQREPENLARVQASMRWTVLAWAAMAAAVLTKGPIGMALPLMIAVAYATFSREWRPLANLIAVLLFVSILLPWIVAVSREEPGFLRYALVTETFTRLTTPEFRRTGPLWYFVPILIAASFPWSAAVLGGWRTQSVLGAKGHRDLLTVYVLMWIIIPFVFFSLSQSKRPQYILPLIPAVGLLLARIWSLSAVRLPGARAAAVALGILGVLFLTISPVFAHAFGASDAVAIHIPATGVMLGSICVVASLAVGFASERRALVLLGLALPVSSIPFISGRLMTSIGKERSSYDMARAIAPHLTSETEIVGVSTYPLGLSFYLNRTITLATETGSELTSNYAVRHPESWRTSPGRTFTGAREWREALSHCSQIQIFIVHRDNEEARSLLRERLPLLAAHGELESYGPCEPIEFVYRDAANAEVHFAF